MEIKDWIRMIASKEIQPECGDIIKKQVVTIGEVFAKQEEVKHTLAQITEQESVLASTYECESYKAESNKTEGNNFLDNYFPQYRHSCYYPTTCEYLPICHLKDWKGDSVNKDVRGDPIGSGLYKWRVPHHKAEKEYLDEQCS
jgi:hypothetical protein